jgi:hypothetical protein
MPNNDQTMPLHTQAANADILSEKINSLIARHQSAAENLSNVDDRNLPVLTEVLAAPEWTPEMAAAAEAAKLAATPVKAALPGTAAVKSLNDAEIDALSQDIFSRVIGRLDEHLGSRLEERLTERIAAQIGIAITQAMSDMQQEIANEIGDVINAALADRLRD